MNRNDTLSAANRAGVFRIVDRCHVSESNLAVCRKVWRSIRKRQRPLVPRALRRTLFRETIARHKANFVLFCYVQGGRV